MKTYFDTKLFFQLTLAFIVCTVLGTLSHELGHFLPALVFGAKPILHFASTSFEAISEITYAQYILIIFGGVIMTLCIGFIGFTLLVKRHTQKIPSKKLEFRDWILAFLTLFLSREPFNYIMHLFVIEKLSDEQNLANLFSWSQDSLSLGLSIAATGIILFVIFKFVPGTQRLSLIVAGLIGSALGYLFWFQGLGPFLIP